MDSIEKLGDPRIARGGFKERIMEPVTTAPLAMADTRISSGSSPVCLATLESFRKSLESQPGNLSLIKKI